MSQVYNLEPPTKGQVVLHTSHGDVEIELWPKEAPKAVRNFAQLCMEGYYDNTIFHRIIKDFMIQGGDPSCTGSGGESIYGRPFKNEFHSRLKFTHRGLVACANVTGKADSNGSQFFISTERCDHLDRQNTIFGRVSGDTIFTVLRIQEMEVDDNDRPTDPPFIKSCEVLLPPFDDIIPRTTPAEKRAHAAAAAEASRLAELRERKQHGKRLNVLSFGNDAEEEEDEVPEAAAVRLRSAHETLQDDARLEKAEVGVHDEHVVQLQKRLADEQRAQAQRDEAAAAAEAAAVAEDRDANGGDHADAFAESMRSKVQAKSADKGEHSRSGASAHLPQNEAGIGDAEQAKNALSELASEEKQFQVAKLDHGKEGSGAAAVAEKRAAEQKNAEVLAKHTALMAKYRSRKRSRGDREAETLAKLKEFRAKLRGARPAIEKKEKTDVPVLGMAAAAMEAGGADTPYDGKVNKSIDHRAYMPASWRIDNYLDHSDDEEQDGVAGLARHRIFWNADDRVADPTARKESVDDYKVIDPLVEAGKAAFNKKQHNAKKRGNEWAGKANV